MGGGRIWNGMTALALDTLSLSRRLRDVGFSEPQADAATGIFNHTREASFDQLATKADLREVKADIRELRTEMKLEIASVKSDLTVLKWMIGLIFAGIIALVMKSFFP